MATSQRGIEDVPGARTFLYLSEPAAGDREIAQQIAVCRPHARMDAHRVLVAGRVEENPAVAGSKIGVTERLGLLQIRRRRNNFV